MSGESKDDVLLGVASGPHFVPGNLELTYGGVTSIAFSADGRNIVSEVRDTQNYMSDISLYDHSCRGKPKLEFLLDYAYNLFDYIVKYSPEWFVSVDSNVASVIASTMWDTVQLNIQDDLIRTWTQGNITHVQFADSHKHRALTADRGGIVAVWSTERENTLATYQTGARIKSLLFSPDGRFAAFSYNYNSFTV